MPSWSSFIKSLINENIYLNNFKNTKFFNFYNNLINDENLNKVMKSYNYTGVFCLHQYFEAQLKDFTKNTQFLARDDCNYQELLLKGSLLITDYSSVFFDFEYLKKPIVYTHFDYEEKYFNYERDGFGPVYSTIATTVNSIISSIKNNCKLEIKYLKRINSFFTFTDEHNNDRIYRQIIKRSNLAGKKYSIRISICLIKYFTFFLLLKIIHIIYITN